jgi:hypothetical protein
MNESAWMDGWSAFGGGWLDGRDVTRDTNDNDTERHHACILILFTFIPNAALIEVAASYILSILLYFNPGSKQL